jgi:G3E family GTPase
MTDQKKPEQKTEGRMRLTVLGGFLGSGKTTWLRHQLHSGRFQDAYIIVNEAAEMPVDDALLGQSNRLSVLAGGCACCAGKSELVAELRRICDKRSSLTGTRPDEILIETSGLADPAPIVDVIRNDPMLVYHIVVTEIIVAVDALHGLSQLRREGLGRKQIEAAGRFIVTKVDESNEGELKTLLATLHQLNPEARLTGAVKGSPAEFPVFENVEPEKLETGGDGVARPPIFPIVLRLAEDADWAALTVWLSALLHARGDDVLRVKGVVRTAAGRLLLQSVRRIMQSPEILPEQSNENGREDNTLVIIGSGYNAEDLGKSLRYFVHAGKN